MKFQQITVESFQRNTSCVEGEEGKNVHDFVVMWREESIETPDKILTVPRRAIYSEKSISCRR